MNRTILDAFVTAASRSLIDREREIELALCCLVAGGNLLIEDTPGVGKTTLVKTLARLLVLDFKRIQFTNDLLPADILGAGVFDPGSRSFSFHKGPIFAQLVLGDELNRASPRTQSAVLQAMDEHEVTIEGVTHALPDPFIFVGTQNPHEHAGTAPLPESQIDRFLMCLSLGLPARSTQRKLLERQTAPQNVTGSQQTIGTPADLLAWRTSAAATHMSPAVTDYILDLFDSARSRGWTLSPRAALGLQRASQARSWLQGRDHVLPEDVQAVFSPILCHRLARFAQAGSGTQEAASMASVLLDSVDPR